MRSQTEFGSEERMKGCCFILHPWYLRLNGVQALALDNCGIDLNGGEVEPEDFAVFQPIQPDPVGDAHVVLAEFENGRGGRAVHEMDPPKRAGTVDVESAHPVAGNAIQIIIAPGDGQANQLDELFVGASEVLAESKQALAMLA